MALEGAVVAVVGDTAASARLEQALRVAGALVRADGPVDYVFHVSTPRAPLGEADIARLLERVDQSGGRLRHVCVVRDPAAPQPSTPQEVRPLTLEDGLRYLAGLHGVPLAEVRASPDGAPGWELAALRAAAHRLAGPVDAPRGLR